MNSSTTASAPITASSTDKPPTKPRPYRRFLTSALHSRFVHAALISLLLALDNAILLGPKHSLFWSWFPLGPAGIRALLFFVTSLFIFFLQIATLNVGKPTATSPFSQLRSTILSFAALQTVVWYLASAWWFTEAYIFGSSSLSWIDQGDLKTPDRLNERPIYIRTFFTMLALAHAVRHLYRADSTLHIPVAQAPTPQSKDQRTHPIQDVYTLFKEQAKSMILRNFIIAGAVTVIGPFVYSTLLRQTLWKIHLALAKPFFNLSRSNARATGFPPLVGIIPKTFALGLLLSLTWEISVFLFLTSLAKPPTKKDKPLSDASKDANGTLLTGLKAKRDVVKSFAFWELVIIAQTQPDRRKSIFNDIDRPTGPIWASMLEEALKVVLQIDTRIEGPTNSKPAVLGTDETKSLPKLLPPASSTDVVSKPVFQPKSSRARIERLVSVEARELGSSSDPLRLPADAAVKMIEGSSISTPRSLKQGITAVKQGPVGSFFASTNAAKVTAKVLGPHGNAGLIVDAIESITKMLIASMQDDAFGKAIKGVPQAVKQFTKTIILIERVIKEAPPSDGDTADVEIIHSRLKVGLTELLSAFQQFLFDTGLSVGELNDAKRASGQKGIEAAKEQQTPTPVEEAKPRRVIKVSKGKSNEQEETWRQWGSQRLPSGEAKQSLFSQHSLTRKSSRGTAGINGTTIPRVREMEQVS